MPTNQFTENVRVSKEIFAMLLKTLEHKWTPGFRSTQIRPDIKLATFLRFLATGSFQRTMCIESTFSTGKSSINRIIGECLKLFEEWICPQWIQMPRPEEERDIMEQFLDQTGFPGVIGCVSGTHILIKSPGSDIKHLYYNKRGYYCINAMVICDHKMNTIYVDARHPGSNHNSFIWEYSLVNQKLRNDFNGGKRNVWILGDECYKLRPFLMTPFKNTCDANERRYNNKHNSTHDVVKRCIGVLRSRFRCIFGS